MTIVYIVNVSSTKFKTARTKARHPTEHIQTGVLCLK